MMTIAICDDEQAICRMLREMLKRHPKADEFQISIFTSCEALCDVLKQGTYFDLVILDIEFPGQNGVETGRFIRETLQNAMTQILYISGKEGYDRLLFEYRPLNFLPKPVQEQKMFRCIDTALTLIREDGACLAFTESRSLFRIPYRNIRYLESYERRITVHETKGEHQFTGKLTELGLPENFVQIHKSFFVNYNFIKAVLFDSVILDDNTNLSISRAYAKTVRAYMLMHGFKEPRTN